MLDYLWYIYLTIVKKLTVLEQRERKGELTKDGK